MINSRKGDENRFELWYWALIFIIVALPVISIGDNLGMYFDSVFPDHAATQLLDDQAYQDNWFISWPLLPQYYHGSLTMFISALAIMLTGTTSIIQHRLINAGAITLCFYVMSRIFAARGIPRRLRRILILVFSFMPTMLGFCLTQYYIELPGTALVLTAFLLLTEKKELSNAKVWLSFALLGIAFYSYFNFLFLFPGFLVLALWNKKNRLDKFIVACSGMVPGASLFAYGYARAFLRGGFLNTSSPMFLIVFAGAVVLFEILLYRLVQMGKDKICLIIYGAFILAALAVCFLMRDTLTTIARNTNLAGYSTTFIERIKSLGRNLYYAVSGVSAEGLIFGYQVTIYGRVTWIIFLGSSVLYLLLMCICKDFRNTAAGWKGLLVLSLYLLCCMPLITRMQTQHFVPLCFLTLITGTIEIYEMIGYISKRFAVKIKYLAVTAMLGMAVMSFLYVRDRYLIVDEIFETGGNRYYTSQINKLAGEALENLKTGKKEIYVFPEWGFMAGFNYLTNNNVAFSTDASKANLTDLLLNGYDLEILYWKNQDTDKYMQELENIAEVEEISKYEYVGNEAIADFYRIEVKTNHRTDWWQQKGQDWYYIDLDGKPHTGWLYWNDEWYYLSSAGIMQTGWIHLDADYYLDESGVMVTGIQEIDGVQYEFDPNGRLIKGER